MADYKVAVNYNVALVSLVKIVPEPTGSPVAPVERYYGVSGKIHDQGGFLVLHFDHVDSPAEYLSMLTLFGLHNADEKEVTVYARSGRLVWTRYNGIAHLPEPGVDMKWSNFFLKDIDVYITDMVPSA